MKKILIIAAHMDDEILGMGGTIQYFKDQGYKIFVCVATDSSSTQYKDNPEIWSLKKREYSKATNLVGVDKIFNLDFPDMRLDSVSHCELNNALNKILIKIKPQILFTHWRYDINMDHQEIYKSTLVLIRPVHGFLKKVYCYETLSSSEWHPEESFIPNHFVDIEKYISKKQEAFSLLKTEVRKYPHPRSLEGVKILAQYRGMQSGNKYAEAFRLIKGYE